MNEISNSHLSELHVYSGAGCGKIVPFTVRKKIIAAMPSYDHRATRAFVACGDSMIERGIRDGDILICSTRLASSDVTGKICVCYVHGEMLTKIVLPNADGTITLRSANSRYSDRVFDANDVQIVGVVTRIQRDVI